MTRLIFRTPRPRRLSAEQLLDAVARRDRQQIRSLPGCHVVLVHGDSRRHGGWK